MSLKTIGLLLFLSFDFWCYKITIVPGPGTKAFSREESCPTIYKNPNCDELFTCPTISKIPGTLSHTCTLEPYSTRDIQESTGCADVELGIDIQTPKLQDRTVPRPGQDDEREGVRGGVDQTNSFTVTGTATKPNSKIVNPESIVQMQQMGFKLELITQALVISDGVMESVVCIVWP